MKPAIGYHKDKVLHFKDISARISCMQEDLAQEESQIFQKVLEKQKHLDCILTNIIEELEAIKLAGIQAKKRVCPSPI